MTMRLAIFIILLAAMSIAQTSGHDSGNTPRRRQHERIQVPLGRRLADVLSSSDRHEFNNSANTANHSRRLFEIEAEDDASNGSTLLVEQVHEMAVTHQTTYNFHHSRKFNQHKIKDISILASDPTEHDGLTIMSIDKFTGDVRGFQRGRTGSMHQISHDHESNKLRVRRALSEEGREMKDWTCETAHAHDDDPERFRMHSDIVEDHWHQHDDINYKSTRNNFGNGNIQPSEDGLSSSSSSSSSSAYAGGAWVEPSKYSFHVDLSIDIDKSFIEKQGGPEAAVEYINVLVSAANVLFEHEVDAHLNIIHIEEQTFYDNLETTKDALRAQRLHPRPYSVKSGSKIILHHAILGRYLGGGIAFIDSICDEQWGYGVTSDVSGRLSDINDLVLFDFFIVTHELGHSLGSGHTFDAYDPPVDSCGACTVKPQGEVEGLGGGNNGRKVTIDGLPHDNAATIMSYCNFCDGGLDNIAITLGGVWDGAQPKENIDHWNNHPDIVGAVSVEPRRVSHNIWQKLASKGECALPPSQPLLSQGCNDDDDCDDLNSCTIDICNEETHLCMVSKTLNNCCGNGVCEAGEGIGPGQSLCSDCGPFSIRAPEFCENCHTLDGFMIDVGLSNNAERSVSLTSISVGFASPASGSVGATIDLYMSNEGSYIGKEETPNDWSYLKTVTVEKYNPRRSPGIVTIELPKNIPLDIGSRRWFYFAASENIMKFGEGVYSVGNEDGLELHSSLAVSGLFGTGINGFSLICELSYSLDDGFSISIPMADPWELARPDRKIESKSPSHSPVISSSPPTPPTDSSPTLPPTTLPSKMQNYDGNDNASRDGTAPVLATAAAISKTPTDESQFSDYQTADDKPVPVEATATYSMGCKTRHLRPFYFFMVSLLPVYLSGCVMHYE